MTLASIDLENLGTVTGGTLPAPRMPQFDDNAAIVGGNRLPGRFLRLPNRDVNGAIVGGRRIYCPYCAPARR